LPAPGGYVTKSIAPADLALSIRRVHDGDAVFSPRLAGFVLDAFAGTTPPSIDPELDQLTPREREVLRFIARGYACKEIARELHISVKTSRAMSRRCCESSNSRTATSSAGGPPTAG
jgi:DNA-binding NarL/FixJ family response regulator